MKLFAIAFVALALLPMQSHAFFRAHGCAGTAASCNGSQTRGCTGTVSCTGSSFGAGHHARVAARAQRRADRHAACAPAAVIVIQAVPACPPAEQIPAPKQAVPAKK